MNLNSLPKIVDRPRKRVGLGIGSGKGGHTSSRGMKGQKARRKIHPLFEGTKTKKSLLQRLPLQRGKGKLISMNAEPFVLNLSDLEKLPQKARVDVQLLIEQGIVSKTAIKKGVKILSGGEITKTLTVAVPTSKLAQEKIEKAGGSVENR